MPSEPDVAKQIALSRHSGEFDLIARTLTAQSVRHATVGIGDDAAVLNGGQLIATDTILEGVHFDAAAPPEAIGHKAIAVNLSDIAAMAGRPTVATLSLTLNKRDRSERAERILSGLLATAAAFGVEVVGGDTTSWDAPLAISVTLLGEAACPVLRSGGVPGDSLFVTGPLGRSLSTGHHLTFTPRVAEAATLAAAAPLHAMIDLSDGLSSDLAHLCAASGCGATLDAAAIPRRDGATIDESLSDGEDFELLFATPIEAVAGAIRIGRLTDGDGIEIRDGEATRTLQPKGWSHGVGG